MLSQEHTNPSIPATTPSTPSPETSTYHQSQPKPGKKREQTKPHPKAKKIPQLQHFLFQGRRNLRQPPYVHALHSITLTGERIP